ncbi:MAG: Unknown protein [uncultured Sulfurovum sp.]|uniref:Alpha/beta hydrolase n=1 Tax=uncultured Sulfurovum sp. TaxID=269237 RepID=A0A6S6UDL4_9BACT|nr:MAG: Unknown protein [uncultured Sulfurovum sp.]
MATLSRLLIQQNKLFLLTFLLLIFLGCTDNKTTVNNYAELGEHKVEKYPTKELKDNYILYYAPKAISPDMPVVFFLEGGGEAPKITHYSGLMHFLASKGYFVIGAESGESYDSTYASNIFEKAIGYVTQEYGLSLSKLAVMGHSQGGGTSFYVMKHFQSLGYASKASLIVSIDGWFSFNMNKKDFQGLNTTIAHIQMNGIKGTGTDPRINLSTWNLAKKSKKLFFTLPHNKHSYVGGNLNSLLTKKDLLYIISALSNDSFTNNDKGYKSIPKQYKTDYKDIVNVLKTKESYPADCAGKSYNAHLQLTLFDIDYCQLK